LAQLGITHIPSYSPEARGRMERVFGTLQGRLPQELRLAEIATIAAANQFLKERFVPDFNARFAVPAAEPGSAFLPYAGRPLEDVLCLQEDRQVGRDNCVRWSGHSWQIPPQRHRHHYVKATVRMHQYPEGRLAIFDGPRCITRFNPTGHRSMPRAPLNSAPRRRPVDLWTTLHVAHNPTGPTSTTEADI
jgi:hypothetical protein